MIHHIRLPKLYAFLLLSTGIIFIFTMNNQSMPLSFIQQLVSDTSSIISNSKLKYFRQLNVSRLLNTNVNRLIIDNANETTTTANNERRQTRHYNSCFEFRINQPNACRTTNYSIAFVIPSTPTRILARNAIRKTWGGYASGIGIPVVFLLGVPMRKYQQEYIENENSLYHDIVQVECVDSYRNLSLKSVAMMKWVSEHCANTDYILKVDDDMIVNVDRLLDTFHRKKFTKTIIGKMMSGFSPHRLKTSKWYVSEKEYQRDHYPNFTSGLCYLFTTDSAKILYENSLDTPYLHLEDVFMTGIVAEKSGIARLANHDFKNAHLSLTLGSFSTFISAHEYSPRTLYQIWSRLKQLPKNLLFVRLQNNTRTTSEQQQGTSSER